MKEIFKQHFPSLLVVAAATPMSILYMNINGASVWSKIASALILSGGLIVISSFVYSVIKHINTNK